MCITTPFLTIALLATPPIWAQAVPAQLKLSEQQAREQLLGSVTSGGPILGAAGKAFVALPASARAAVVNAGFAWMKTYVNSPAFKTAYGQARENAKPAASDAQGTVDQELKRQQDEQLKQLADSRAMLSMLPARERAAAEQNLKQAEAQIKSPEMQRMMRVQIEQQRKDNRTRCFRAGREAVAAARTAATAWLKELPRQ